MQITVDVVETARKKVNVSGGELASTIRNRLIREIAPPSTAGYDDWYIKDGLVYGITTYYHGSDSNTYLEEATGKLEQDYNAIHRVCHMLQALKD